MRQLKMSWQELQEAPDFYVEVWEAYLEGEAQAQTPKT